MMYPLLILKLLNLLLLLILLIITPYDKNNNNNRTITVSLITNKNRFWKDASRMTANAYGRAAFGPLARES